MKVIRFILFTFLACTTVSNLFSQSCTSGCTYTISALSNQSYTLTAGQQLCITTTGIATGNITLNGGTVCNSGLIQSPALTVNSGTINNYGSIYQTGNLKLDNTSTLNNYSIVKVAEQFLVKPTAAYHSWGGAKMIAKPFTALATFGGKYWVGNGTNKNWNDVSNWSYTSGGSGGAPVPTATDTVYFNGGGTGQCSVNTTVSVKRIVIDSSYTDTIKQNSNYFVVGTGGYLQNGGTFIGTTASPYYITVQGAFTLNKGTFKSTSNRFTVQNNFTIGNAATFLHNNGEVFFTGVFTIKAAVSLYNCTLYPLSGVGGTYTLDATTALTVEHLLTYSSAVVNGSGVINAQGDILQNAATITNGGTATININGSGNQTFTGSAGTVPNFTGGGVCNININKTNSSTLFLSGFIVVTGNWTNQNNTTINAGTSTVIFCTSKTITESQEFENVSFYTPSFATVLTIATGTKVVAKGKLSIGGASMTINGGNIEARGNIEALPYASGAGFIGGTSNIVINGTGNQTFTGYDVASPGIEQFRNIEIDKTSGTLYFDKWISVNNNWNFKQGNLGWGSNDPKIVFMGGTIMGANHTLKNVTFYGPSGSVTSFTINASTTLTVDGLLKIMSYGSGRVNINTGNIYATGDIKLDVGNNISIPQYYGGSATIYVNGANNNQTIDGTSIDQTQSLLPNVIINKTGTGTLTLTNKIPVGGNWTVTAVPSLVSTGSLVSFVGYTPTITGSHALNDVTLVTTTSNNSVATVASGTTLTVNGKLTTTGPSISTINTGNIDLYGDLKIDNTYSQSAAGGSGTITLKGNNNQTITGATAAGRGRLCNFAINKSGGIATFVNTLSVAGNWSWIAGNTDYKTNGATIALTTSTSRTITGNQKFGKLLFFGDGANTNTLPTTDSVIVEDSLKFNGTGTISLNTGNIYAKGNIYQQNTVSSAGGGSGYIVICGSNNQSFKGNSTGLAGVFCNVTINKSAGTLTLANTISLSGTSTWRYIQGTVDPGTSNVVLLGGATVNPGTTSSFMQFYDFTVQGGTTTNMSGPLYVRRHLAIDQRNLTTNNYDVTVGGNFTGVGSTVSGGTSTFTFNGSGNQRLEVASNLYNVTINKPSGKLYLDYYTLSVSNSLTLTKGVVVSTASTKLVKLLDNATVSGGSNRSYVSGLFTKIGDDAFTYPLGDTTITDTSYYHPFAMTAPTGATSSFTAQYFAKNVLTDYSTFTAYASTLKPISTCEYWSLTRNVGTSTITPTVSWNKNTCNINALADARVAGWNGSQWADLGQNSTTGNQSAGTVKANTAGPNQTNQYYVLAERMPTPIPNQRYWVGNGSSTSWSNTANWSNVSGGPGGSPVPSSLDTVIYDGGGKGESNVDANVNIAKLTVKSAYNTNAIKQNSYSITVATGGMSLSGGTFTGGSGNIINNGPFTLSGTNFTSTSGTLTLYGDYTKTSGTFTHNSGTVIFKMTNTISGSTDFYNLEFFPAGDLTHTLIANDVYNVAGEMKLSGTTRIVINSGTLHLKGNLTITNTNTLDPGNYTLSFEGNANQIVNGPAARLQGALNHLIINKTGGSVTLNNFLSIAGNWTNTSNTTVTGSNTSTVVFNGGSKTISGNNNNFYSLNLYSNGPADGVYTISNPITVNGELKLDGSAPLYLNGSVNAKGNITAFYGNGDGGTGTITINGDGNQLFSGYDAAQGSRLCNIVIDKASGTLTLANYLTPGHDWKHIKGTVDPGSSVTYITNSGSKKISGHNVFNDVIFYGYLYNYDTCHVDVEDTLFVNGQLKYTLRSMTINGGYVAAKGNINIENDGTVAAGTHTLLITGGNNQLFTGLTNKQQRGVLNNVIINKSGGMLTLKDKLTVVGNWIWQNGNMDVDTYDNTLILRGGTRIFGGTHSLKNVILDGYDTNDPSINNIPADDVITIKGELKIDGAHTGRLNTGTINALGNLTSNNYSVTEDGGSATINIIGTGDQTISGQYGGGGLFCNIKINKTSGTLNMSGSITLGGSNWTYLQGTVNPGTSKLIYWGNGNINLANESNSMELNSFDLRRGTVNMLSPITTRKDFWVSSVNSTINTNSHNINVGGYFLNGGTFNQGTTVITFNGTGRQDAYNANSTTFYKVVINKPAGNVYVDGGFAINNNLTLVKGAMVPRNSTLSHYVKILDGATITGGSNASFIMCGLMKVGSVAFTYPMGDTSLTDSARYHPFRIGASASSATYAVRYFHKNPLADFPTYTPLQSPLKAISTCEYWYVEGGPALAPTLNWNNSCNISDMTDIRVASWDGTQWKNLGNNGTTGNLITGSITAASPSTSAYDKYFVIANVNASIKLYTAYCDNSIPLTTQLLASDNNSTHAFYRFEFSTTSDFSTYNENDATMNKELTINQNPLFKTVSGLQLDHTYYVRIRTKESSNASWSEAGPVCSVGIINDLKLHDSQCGQNIPLATTIEAKDNTLAFNFYRFEFSNNSSFTGYDANDASMYKELAAGQYPLYNTVSGLQIGSTYYVRMRLRQNSGDSWSSAGPVCQVNFINTLKMHASQCDQNVSLVKQMEATDNNSVFNFYRFEFATTSDFSGYDANDTTMTEEAVKNQYPRFRMVSGLQLDQTYYVRIRLKANSSDVWSGPGPVCSVAIINDVKLHPAYCDKSFLLSRQMETFDNTLSYNYYRYEFSTNATFAGYDANDASMYKEITANQYPTFSTVSGLHPDQNYYARVRLRLKSTDSWSSAGPVCNVSFAPNPSAHVKYWVGNNNNKNWTNTANWSGTSGGSGGVPVPAELDSVYFDGGGNGEMVLDNNVNIKMLRIANSYAGTIKQNNKTITIGTSGAVFGGGTFQGDNGDITDNGSFAITGANFTNTKSTLTIKGDFAFTSGTFTHNSSTVLFDGGTKSISGNPSFYNLQLLPNVAGDNVYTIPVTDVLVVKGEFKIADGGAPALVNGGTINAEGNITTVNVNGSPTAGGTGLIKICGTGNQVFTGGATVKNGRLCNITIDKPNGILTLVNTITVGGNWTYVKGIVNPGTSTLAFSNTTNRTISGRHRLNNLWFYGDSYEEEASELHDTLIVEGELKFTGPYSTTINTGVIAAKGNITIQNDGDVVPGTYTLWITGSGNQLMKGITMKQQRGTLNHVIINKQGGVLSLKDMITVKGNWIYQSGTIDATTKNSTLVLRGGTRTFSGKHTLNNILLFGYDYNEPSTNNIPAQDTITVVGELKYDGNYGASLNTGTINSLGNVVSINTTTGQGGGTGTINICGNGTQLLSGQYNGTGRFCNIKINKTSGTLNLSGFVTLGGSSFTYLRGDVNVGTSSIIFWGDGNINTANGTSSIDLYNLDVQSGYVNMLSPITTKKDFKLSALANQAGIVTNSHDIHVGGYFMNGGGMTIGTSTIIFNGEGNQDEYTVAGTYYKVVVDKPSGNIIVDGTFTIGTNLNLIKGILVPRPVSSGHLVKFLDNATVTGGSDISYIATPVIKVGDDAFTFPVGDVSVSGPYHPISISAPSQAATVYTAQYFAKNQLTDHPTFTTLESPLQSISSCEYWALSTSNANENITPTLSWNANGCNIRPLSSLLVGSWNGTKWTSLGQASTTGNVTKGTITALNPGPLVSSQYYLIADTLPPPTTYTVTSTADGSETDGVSLRWAIAQANLHPGSTIAFNFSGTAPHTITLSSALPVLTQSNTTIDGSTQPANGFTGVGPKVIISGGGTISKGIEASSTTDQVKLYGLELKSFTNYGIYLPNNENHIIGAIGKGNVIHSTGSATTDAAIYVKGGIIKSNVIGLDAAGTTGQSNSGIGISVNGGVAIIGGNVSGEGNIIAANGGDGIYLNNASNSTVKGNKIGVNAAGGKAGNTGKGISLVAGSSHVGIGGTFSGEGNIIANNASGVVLDGSATLNNTILHNEIYCNTEDEGLKFTNGANTGAAAAVITTANETTLAGTASPNAILDIYVNDSCSVNQGKRYLTSVTADGSGNWAIGNTTNGAISVMSTTASAGSSRFASLYKAGKCACDVPVTPVHICDIVQNGSFSFTNANPPYNAENPFNAGNVNFWQSGNETPQINPGVNEANTSYAYMWSMLQGTTIRSEAIRTNVPVKAGKTYELKYRVRKDPNTALNNGSSELSDFYAVLVQKDFYMISYLSASQPTPTGSFTLDHGTALSSTNWVERTVVFTPTSDYGSLMLYPLQANSDKFWIDYDDVSLTEFTVNAGADVLYSGCGGQPSTIGSPQLVTCGFNESETLTYSWSPSTYLSCTNCPNPTLTNVLAPISYTLTVSDAAGHTATDQVNVTVGGSGIIADAGQSASSFEILQVTLGGSTPGSGGTAPYSYTWMPATGLSSITDPHPTAIVSETTTYTLSVKDASGCVSIDMVTITRKKCELVVTPGAVLFCPNDQTIQLQAVNKVEGVEQGTFTWSGSGLSCTNCSNPLLTAASAQNSIEVKVSVPEKSECATRVVSIFKDQPCDPVGITGCIFGNYGSTVYVSPGTQLNVYCNLLNEIGTDNNGAVTQGAFQNKGNINVKLDWIHNAQNDLFTTQEGITQLFGGRQALRGVSSTKFNQLDLTGNDVKQLFVNEYCYADLNFDHTELALGNYNFYTLNANSAISGTIQNNGAGFISTDGTGYLSRNMSAATSYLFPLGSKGDNLNPFRFRPVDIKHDGVTDVAKVNFVNKAPDPLVYSPLKKAENLSSVNKNYYHNINHESTNADNMAISLYFAPTEGEFQGIAHWQPNPTATDYYWGGTPGQDVVSTPNTAGLVYAKTTGTQSFDKEPYILARTGFYVNTDVFGKPNNDVSPIVGDLNGDGIINVPSEIAGDNNGDGVINAPLEIAGDVNGDGAIDGMEIAGDRDGDGIIETNEAVGDINGDGTINGSEVASDSNGDGSTGPDLPARTIVTVSPATTGTNNTGGGIDQPFATGVTKVFTPKKLAGDYTIHIQPNVSCDEPGRVDFSITNGGIPASSVKFGKDDGSAALGELSPDVYELGQDELGIKLKSTPALLKACVNSIKISIGPNKDFVYDKATSSEAFNITIPTGVTGLTLGNFTVSDISNVAVFDAPIAAGTNSIAWPSGSLSAAANGVYQFKFTVTAGTVSQEVKGQFILK